MTFWVTSPSSWRVCQFRHPGERKQASRWGRRCQEGLSVYVAPSRVTSAASCVDLFRGFFGIVKCVDRKPASHSAKAPLGRSLTPATIGPSS